MSVVLLPCGREVCGRGGLGKKKIAGFYSDGLRPKSIKNGLKHSVAFVSCLSEPHEFGSKYEPCSIAQMPWFYWMT